MRLSWILEHIFVTLIWLFAFMFNCHFFPVFIPHLFSWHSTFDGFIKGLVYGFLQNIDIRVRDKILVLLDSWQQSFGGPMGKFPQYYWAYDELRVCMVEKLLHEVPFHFSLLLSHFVLFRCKMRIISCDLKSFMH